MKFYRFEKREYTASSIPNPRLEMTEFVLIKETPKGYWIGQKSVFMNYFGKKWISKTSRKRYAYPTIEEALMNYILRTERRIEILKHQLHSCEVSLGDAKKKYSVDFPSK